MCFRNKTNNEIHGKIKTTKQRVHSDTDVLGKNVNLISLLDFTGLQENVSRVFLISLWTKFSHFINFGINWIKLLLNINVKISKVWKNHELTSQKYPL